MRFDHAIFLEGFLSREKEDGSKKGGYRGNRRGLINRKGEDQGWQQCVSGRTMGEGRSCDKRRGRGLWSSLKSPFRRRRPFTLRLLKDYLHPSFIDPRHSRDCRLSHSYIYVYMYICMHIYMYRNIWAGFDLVSGGGRKGEGEIRLTNLASCKSEIKFYRGWKVREARKVASQSTYIKLLLTRNLHRLPTPPHSTSIIVVTNCLFQESLGAIKRGFPILGDDSFRWCLFFPTFFFFSDRFRESII